MFKHARLFAAILVLAGASSVPGQAHAIPILYAAARTFVCNVSAGSPGHDYRASYLLRHCD